MNTNRICELLTLLSECMDKIFLNPESKELKQQAIELKELIIKEREE